MRCFIVLLVFLLQFLYASDNYFYKNQKQESLTKLHSTLRINTNFDYYKTINGVVVGVSDKLIVKLKKEDNLKKYLIRFDLIMEAILSKNMYLLKTKDKTLTIDISNRLSEEEDVEYAHPDFIQKRELR